MNISEKQIIELLESKNYSIKSKYDMNYPNAYADVLAAARKAGRGIEAADAVIAAIALDSGFSVARRDVSPFLAAGVKVINPWQA